MLISLVVAKWMGMESICVLMLPGCSAAWPTGLPPRAAGAFSAMTPELGLEDKGLGRHTRRAAKDSVLFKCLFSVLYSPPKHLLLEKYQVMEVASRFRVRFLKTVCTGVTGIQLLFVLTWLLTCFCFVVAGPCCSPGWIGRLVSAVWRRAGNNSIICGCHLQAYGPCGDWAIN